jgi:hypothetical protein
MPQPPHKYRKRIMSLEGRTERVFQALMACGPGWHGRIDIARKMGTLRLEREDIAMLSSLAQAGRIKAKQRPFPCATLVRWEYKIPKETTEEANRAGQPPAAN